ncbi:hypothetical protein H109_05586 [Trichophyton interdigitale MR816]|uniref:Uncharacterized protein n=1 Tax=Trichophyton interdigitale (strain MR816) TaxID=1215338 RepID=A0A059J3U7_TRIIM|nr:hypothetical protein H101_01447 [Trichophyton interdigitale H6]KDB22515.1 hypothetical protein H109_05586 [Trichophyton interdigitale MR816]
MGAHHIDRRKHWKGPEYRIKDIVQREVEQLPKDRQNNETPPKHETTRTTTVVLTVIEAVLMDGTTAAVFTVPSLPATVSHSRLGVVTIPSGSKSPIIVSPFPTPQTKIPDLKSVSQPPPSQPSKPSTNVSLPSSKHSLPSTHVSLPSSQHSSPSTHVPQPSKPSTNSSSPSTIPVTSHASTSILPNSSSKDSSIPSNTQSTPPSESSKTSTLSTLNSSTSTSKPASISSTHSVSSSTSYSPSSSHTFSSSSISLSSVSTSSASKYPPGGGGGELTGGHPQPTAPTEPNGDPSKAASNSDVPKIVGGVVGGVAGIALIIILLLLLRRVRKRKAVRESSNLTGGIMSSRTSADRNTFSTSNTSQLSGTVLGGATRVFDRFRTSTASMAGEPVERGFQKIGGRKLASVLETGGDGYDDKFGTDEKSLIVPPRPSGHQTETTATGGEGSTGNGLHKELGLGGAMSRTADRPISDESIYSERVAFRPSPARTPIATPVGSAICEGIATTPQSGIVAPSEPLPAASTPSGRDEIGRSLAAADGSRASKFTEGV